MPNRVYLCVVDTDSVAIPKDYVSDEIVLLTDTTQLDTLPAEIPVVTPAEIPAEPSRIKQEDAHKPSKIDTLRLQSKVRQDSIQNLIEKNQKEERARLDAEKKVEKTLVDAERDSVRNEKKRLADLKRQEKLAQKEKGKQRRAPRAVIMTKEERLAEKAARKNSNIERERQYEEIHRRVTELEQINKQLRKADLKTNRLDARLHNMPMRRFKIWSQYFKDNDNELKNIVNQIDTVRHDTIVHVSETTKADVKENAANARIIMTELFNKKHERERADERTAIAAYDSLAQRIKEEAIKKRYSDSLELVQKRKESGRMYPIYPLIKRRDKQRQTRVWREIDEIFLSGDQSEFWEVGDNRYGEITSKSNFNHIWQKDSVFSTLYDKYGADNFKRFTLRTNILGWMCAVPNMGVEFDLSSKPSSQYSLLVQGALKPNTNTVFNPRFSFNIMQVEVQLRKYWRTGDMGYGEIWHEEWNTQFDYGPRGYGYKKMPGEDEYSREAYLSEMAADRVELIRSEKRDSTYGWQYDIKVLPDTAVTFKTRSWLHRLWQPLRYNKLSQRFAKTPSIYTMLYAGPIIGAEKYHWLIGDHGRQGKSLYAGVSFGVRWQMGHGRWDIELGTSVCGEYTSYKKFSYDSEARCYPLSGIYPQHFTNHPVLKDIHLTLAYRLHSVPDEVQLLFMTDKYYKKMARKHHRNRIESERSASRSVARIHNESSKKLDVYRQYLKTKNYKEHQDYLEEKKNYEKENPGKSYDEHLAREQREKEEKRLNSIVPVHGKVVHISDDDL